MIDKFYYSDGASSEGECWGKPLHREDGPAIEWADGGKEWWIDDKRHRTNGPAIEWGDGGKEWWSDGNRIVFYHGDTGNYELYDAARTVVTEEQVRLILAKHGIEL